MGARVDGLFSGRTSVRVPRERRVAAALLLTVPVTIALIGLVSRSVTLTQVALLFVAGMVFVALNRGRLLGSSIRARRTEFPELVDTVERLSERLGIPPPQVFVRDDYFVPVNAIGLGEPYALVISSQYLQIFAPDELAFMVGRELGHIASGNTRLLSLINATGRSNPIIASLFGGWIRQTEYTADRAGLLCVSLDAALRAIAVATFHASGRRIEPALLADQRRDIESDLTLRLGELIGNMPYAVNRVRALEVFAASDLYRDWVTRLAIDPLPVHVVLGSGDGPVERRELAAPLRRLLALGIDLTILSVIFDAVNVTVGGRSAAPGTVYIGPLALTGVKSFLSNNASLLGYFPYAAGLVAVTGRTIGMMVLDLRVVRVDHGRVGIGQALWRYLAAALGTVLVVPLLVSLVRPLQLHDRLSGSRLIGGRTMRMGS